MKLLAKVIECYPQRQFTSQRGEQIVAAPLQLSQGSDKFYGEAYGQQALTMPQNLGAGEMVWVDVSFVVSRREHEGRTFYEQRVSLSNIERV